MIIDAHNHPEWHKHGLKLTLENMNEYNIDMAWLLTWECPIDEYADCASAFSPLYQDNSGPIPLAACVAFAERAPDRFVLGYAPDPRRRGAIDRLDAAIALYDIRVCGELKVRMMFDNPDALRLFRFCAAQNLPVIVHLDYDLSPADSKRSSFWYGGSIEALERAIQLCPETIFIGHAPGFWANISADGKHLTQMYPKGKVVRGGKLIKMLRRYPNLYCDMSAGSGHNAMARDPTFAKEFLEEFQDRVLYGRDFFDNNHQELLNSMKLSPAVLSKIYAGNALRLIKGTSKSALKTPKTPTRARRASRRPATS